MKWEESKIKKICSKICSKNRELSKNEIREKYNKFAKWYYLTEIVGDIIYQKYRKELFKNIKGKVLGVGMGTGINLKYYNNCEIYGVDISNKMLKKAESRVKKLKIKAHLIEGDSENLPFEDSTFDYVIDSLGLCTYPNPIKALQEMKRACKRNGRILLLEHGKSNNKFIVKWQKWREPKHKMVAGCHLLRNPLKLVNEGGLEITKHKRNFFGIIYIIEAKKIVR